MRIIRPRDPSRYAKCEWDMCREPSSDKYPIPMCTMHILEIWSWVENDRIESGLSREQVIARRQEQHARIETAAPQNRHPGWVYYLRIGSKIKIGYTKRIYRRLGQYPPDTEVLALHKGTLDDEKIAHSLFTAHRVAGREWYRPHPDLMTHIDALVAEHGKPTIRYDWTRQHRRNRAQK